MHVSVDETLTKVPTANNPTLVEKAKLESAVKKDKQTVVKGKGQIQTYDNHEFNSMKEIQHNSGEKSKSH
ncbi:MAG: hypothetical protein LBE39_11820 [Flavobacteriaceae bacterium]|nr:hypothetical protein [Flavobacteriaceae bacterium]